jgi:hypothetical protein
MAEIVQHEDGVYLSMREEPYFADWALGFTGLKLLLSSPPDWWWQSPFNQLVPHQERGEEESKAMRFGSAVHTALLESMDVFSAVYGVMPDKFTHPRALDTTTQLKERLGQIGEKISGNKPELIERLLAADPSAVILEEIQQAWLAEGRKPLSRVEFNKIHLMERVLMGPIDPETKERRLTALGKAFQGGLSEVSVFWTDENGIRQRARLDKLKPNATIDLKTFSNWQGRDFQQAMLRDAAIKLYHMQAAHYEEARRQLRRLVGEGKVFAPNPSNPELKAKVAADLKLLEEIAAADHWRWVWVFYKTDGAPRAKGVIMNWQKEHAGIHEDGAFKRTVALANFVQYREFFGLDPEGPMWADPEQLWTPDTVDWPMSAQVVD